MGGLGVSNFVAFISYSHRDKRWGSWLHRSLETYRVPKQLVGKPSPIGPIPQRMRPVFRDRDELSASASLGQRIEEALANSRSLLVLCSPAAAKSQWTNQEIATFKRNHPDRPILAAIIGGEPFASGMPGREEEECFPPALRFELEPDGSLSDRRAEPIAADFRPGGDGKRLGKLKLISGILDVRLDELVQRDAARRNRRLAVVAAASVAGMVGTSALALYAFEQRTKAVEQREQADGLIEFMLTDLRKRLEPVGRLDALESVGEEALDYYAQQDLDDLDADAMGRRSRALLMVGDVAERRGDNASAMKTFEQSARTTGELLARNPNDWQRIFDHAQSVFWVGYMAGEMGEPRKRLKHLEEYERLTDRLVELRPDDRTSQFEAAAGKLNLGVTLYQNGELERAPSYLAAAYEGLVPLAAGDPDMLTEVANAAAHRATLSTRRGEDAKAVEFRRAQLNWLRNPSLDQKSASVRVGQARSLIALARSSSTLGKPDEALKLAEDSLRIWRSLVALDRTNLDWQEGEAIATAVKGEALIQLNEDAKASDAARAAIAVASRIVAGQAEEDIASLRNLVALRIIALDTGEFSQVDDLVRDTSLLEQRSVIPGGEEMMVAAEAHAALSAHYARNGASERAAAHGERARAIVGKSRYIPTTLRRRLGSKS